MKIAHLAVLVLGLSACGTVTAADTSPDAGGDVRGAGGSATGGSAGLSSGGSTGFGGVATGGDSGTGGAPVATGGSPGSGGINTGTGGGECVYTLCGSPPGCVDTAYDANNCGSCGHVCGFGKLCVGATCIDGPPGTGGTTGGGAGGSTASCGSGQLLCSSGCVDATNDRSHCGNCATACSSGQTCVNGSCGS